MLKEMPQLLKKLLGKASEESLISKFKTQLVDKGKLPERSLTILKEIAKAKRDAKKAKGKHEVDKARKDAFELTSRLIEYAQRCELDSIDKQMQKNKLRIKYGKGKEKKEVDAFCLSDGVYVIMPDAIKRVTNAGILEASKLEFEKAFEKNEPGRLDGKILSNIKKLLGEFEIILK